MCVRVYIYIYLYIISVKISSIIIIIKIALFYFYIYQFSSFTFIDHSELLFSGTLKRVNLPPFNAFHGGAGLVLSAGAVRAINTTRCNMLQQV